MYEDEAQRIAKRIATTIPPHIAVVVAIEGNPTTGRYEIKCVDVREGVYVWIQSVKQWIRFQQQWCPC